MSSIWREIIQLALRLPSFTGFLSLPPSDSLAMGWSSTQNSVKLGKTGLSSIWREIFQLSLRLPSFTGFLSLPSSDSLAMGWSSAKNLVKLGKTRSSSIRHAMFAFGSLFTEFYWVFFFRKVFMSDYRVLPSFR